MSDAVPSIRTLVARAGYDDHRWFGRSVLGDMLGREGYVDLIVTAVCGRRPDPTARPMLDDLAVAMTAADPRIWPLKLVRVIASYGGTLTAFAAGVLGLEGDLLGAWTTGEAARNLEALAVAVGDDASDHATVERCARALIAERPRLVGYGVAFRARDERYDALCERVRVHGRETLPYWRLQQVLTACIEQERRLPPNISAALAAIWLDLGLRADEVPAATMFLNQNVFVANAVEGARDAAGAAILRSLPVAAIEYVGPAPRISPRAAATAATAGSRGSRPG